MGDFGRLYRFEPRAVFRHADEETQALAEVVTQRLGKGFFRGDSRSPFNEDATLRLINTKWPAYTMSLAAVWFQLSFPGILGALERHSLIFQSPQWARKRGVRTASIDDALYARDNAAAFRGLVALEEAHRNIPVSVMPKFRMPVQASRVWCAWRATMEVTGQVIPLSMLENAWTAERRIEEALQIPPEQQLPTFKAMNEYMHDMLAAMVTTDQMRQRMHFLWNALPPYLSIASGYSETVTAKVFRSVNPEAVEAMGLPIHNNFFGPSIELMGRHPRSAPSGLVQLGVSSFLTLALSRPLEARKDVAIANGTFTPADSGFGLGLVPAAVPAGAG